MRNSRCKVLPQVFDALLHPPPPPHPPPATIFLLLFQARFDDVSVQPSCEIQAMSGKKKVRLHRRKPISGLSKTITFITGCRNFDLQTTLIQPSYLRRTDSPNQFPCNLTILFVSIYKQSLRKYAPAHFFWGFFFFFLMKSAAFLPSELVVSSLRDAYHKNPREIALSPAAFAAQWAITHSNGCFYINARLWRPFNEQIAPVNHLRKCHLGKRKRGRGGGGGSTKRGEARKTLWSDTQNMTRIINSSNVSSPESFRQAALRVQKLGLWIWPLTFPCGGCIMEGFV